MSKVLKEKIIDLKEVAHEIFKMTIKSDYISSTAKPGQFVNIKCGDGLNALLRRPISICRVDRSTNTFDILFQIKGVGTEMLAKNTIGSEVDLMGPLGNPFSISEEYKRIAVIGGGIGTFPLLYILEEYKEAYKSTFLGFRNKEALVLQDEFGAASNNLQLSSDDGSVGYNGLVTDLLIKDLENNSYDIIYTCGPTPMIKKVHEIASKNNIKCQVSLEERMGCGIGACLVCACKTKKEDDWEYSHVCKDGPIFWSTDVVFE